jgi:GlpG protein
MVVFWLELGDGSLQHFWAQGSLGKTMTAFYVALQLPEDLNLESFSTALSFAGIPHRITRDGVYQLVWVPEAQSAEGVIEQYRVWQATTGEGAKTASIGQRVLINSKQFPLTAGLILLNFGLIEIGLSASSGDLSGWITWMTITPFSLLGDYWIFEPLASTFESHQYWRLLTPALIHFSWMHLAFNMLWVWELGRRIERLHGGLKFLFLTLVSAISANLLQVFLTGPTLFGGMSGVVFAYLGYCMVWDWRMPKARIGLAPAAYWVMVGFLVLGFTGLFDLIGLGSIANGAHLGGFVVGVLLGFCFSSSAVSASANR